MADGDLDTRLRSLLQPPPVADQPADPNNPPGFDIPGMGQSGDIARLLQTVAPALRAPPGAPPSPAAPAGAAPRARVPTGLPGLPAMPTPPGRGPITLPQPPEAKYSDPLEALGNPLTALALIGSAFTRRPATTAIMSLAGALKAQQAGDQQRYANQYQKYTQEVQKAHTEAQADQAEYKRIYENRRLSLQERMASLRGRAAGRSDAAMLAYLDAGGDPGVLLDDRKRAVAPISDALAKRADIYKIMTEHPEMTHLQAEAEWKARKKEAETAADRGGAKTDAQERNKAIEESLQRHAADPEWTRAKSIAEVTTQIAEAKASGTKAGKMAGGVDLTGNQRAKEMQRQGQIEESLDKVDKALATLNKYRMAAGAAGYATRGKEIAENIFGGNQTDREQFRRDIEFLRLMMPRVIAGGSRPLAMDSKRVDAIIGGLSMGDTTANTIRSLEETRDMYLRAYKLQQQILGAETPAPGGTAPPAAAPPAGIDWDQFQKAK